MSTWTSSDPVIHWLKLDDKYRCPDLTLYIQRIQRIQGTNETLDLYWNKNQSRHTMQSPMIAKCQLLHSQLTSVVDVFQITSNVQRSDLIANLYYSWEWPKTLPGNTHLSRCGILTYWLPYLTCPTVRVRRSWWGPLAYDLLTAANPNM